MNGALLQAATVVVVGATTVGAPVTVTRPLVAHTHHAPKFAVNLDAAPKIGKPFLLAVSMSQTPTTFEMTAADAIFNVTPAGPGEFIMEKVDELRALHDGALGPGSLAPSDEVLDRLLQLDTPSHDLRLVPTASGSVIVEWNAADVEYTAEIEPNGTLFLCVDDPDEDVEELETGFDLDLINQFIATGRIPV